jgi:Tfp pilus assembly protein PilF
VSLLLNALKRAEHEKRAREEPGPQAPSTRPPGLELEPIRAAAPANAASVKAEPPLASPSAATSPRSRPALWIGAAALVLIVLAGSIYVWMTISALDGRAVPVARAAPPPPPPPRPVEPTATAPITGIQAPANIPGVAPSALVELRSPPPASAAKPVDAAASARAPVAPPVAAEATAPETSHPVAAEPMLLARVERPARIPAEVAAGYEALRRGDSALARRSYAAALAADPASVDALLGLATVEARAGQRFAAAQQYRRVLEQEPRNPTALAGLAMLADGARPDALEQQLAADLAQDPASAALQLAIGNLHASQQRWTQAQAAYFEAHRLDPGNADIVYNLAVSLDHLGQSKIAADFYARALEAARSHGAQFDAATAERRLADIRAGR